MPSCFKSKKTEIIKLTSNHENISLQSVNEEDFERDKPFVFLEEDNLDDQNLENETNFTVEAHQTAQNAAEFISILQSDKDHEDKIFQMLRKDEGVCNRSLDEDGNRALHIATKYIRDRAATNLVDNIARWADEYYSSVIMEIIARSPNQITLQNNLGETPLIFLAASGLGSIFEKIVKQLKVEAEGFNIPDNQGNTVLHYVVLKAENLDLAMYLVSKNANLMARNNEGMSPLFYAVQRGWPPASAEALEEEDLTEEKMQELNTEAEKQSWYRKFFHAAMKVKPRHPLEMVATGTDADEPEMKPFILAMWEASPVAANIIFQQLEADKSFERGVTYVKYNYAINQEGYNFMLSGGQEGVLHILENDTGVFVKKAPIKAMLDCFWDYSIRKIVLMEMVVFLWVLISASVMINLAVVAKSAGETQNSFGQQVAASVFGVFVVIGTSVLMATELYHATHQGMGYLQDYWNYPDWISSCTIMYMSIKYLVTQEEWINWERNVLAVGILYMWMKTLEFASAFERTSPIARLFLRMLQTIFQYLVMILIFILAFSHSFYLVLSDTAESYSDVPKAMITLYRGMMGDFDYDPIEQSDTFLATLLFIAFTLTGIILLLNLLIALMTNVYEEVKADIETAYLQSKANMIAKKLRVYILGAATTTIVHQKFLLPKLHEWQLSLPDENKMNPIQRKWAQFIRATLFRPDRFQVHPNYKEWYQGEEDRYGVVTFPIKNEHDQSQEVQIQGLRTKMSQTSAKLSKQLGLLKKQIDSVRTDIEGTNSTLVTLRDKATVSDVAKQLMSDNSMVREKALHHIMQYKTKDERIVLALLQLINEDYDKRELIVKTLGYGKVAVIVLMLHRALELSDERVQEAMLRALKDDRKEVSTTALSIVARDYFKPSSEMLDFLIYSFNSMQFQHVQEYITQIVLKAPRTEPAVLDIILLTFTRSYSFTDKDRFTTLDMITKFEDDEKVTATLLYYMMNYWRSPELRLKIVETFGNLAPYVKKYEGTPESTIQDFIDHSTCLAQCHQKPVDASEGLVLYCATCRTYVCRVCAAKCHQGHRVPTTKSYPHNECQCKYDSTCVAWGDPNDDLREKIVDYFKREISQEGNRAHKLAIVTALRNIGHFQSVYQCLEIAMNDKDDSIRSAALQSMFDLAEASEDTCTFLKGLLSKTETGHLARACTATIFQQLCTKRKTLPEDVKEALKVGLKDKYWAVRANCASALGLAGSVDDITVEGIFRLVRDRKPQVAVAAVKALTQMKFISSKLVSILTELIQVTDNLDLKADIIHTFTTHLQRGGFFVIPSTIKNLKSTQESDLKICVEENYCNTVVESLSYTHTSIMVHDCKTCAKEICPQCASTCHKDHTTWKKGQSKNGFCCSCPGGTCACKTVDTNMHNKVKRIILRILSSLPDHKNLILNCLETLELYGKDELSAPAVVPYMTHPDAQVKMGAIKYFMTFNIQTPHVLKTLTELLSDDHGEVRVKAADALELLGKNNTDLIPPLLEIISSGKTFGKINAVIVISSLGIEDQRIHEAFIRCLRNNDDVDLRTWVTHSWPKLAPVTGAIRTKAVYALIESWQGDNSQDHVGALLQHWNVGETEYCSLLISMLSYEIASVRRAGAIALCRCHITDMTAVLAALKQALNDPEDSVKKAAQGALKVLTGK